MSQVDDSLATQGNPEESDAFGAAVTVGDFDEPAGDDPAVGAPGETVSGRPAAGAVSVFSGPPNGLVSERLLFQETAGIPGNPEAGDAFGTAVAPTDTTGIGQWDLAVGVPSESVGPDVQTGVVNLLAGSATGPSGGTLLQQTNPENFDAFGQAIAGGFFLHDFDKQRLLRPGSRRSDRAGRQPAGRRRGQRVLRLRRGRAHPRAGVPPGQRRARRRCRGLRLLRGRPGVAQRDANMRTADLSNAATDGVG
jgi:hypothetical protein